MGITTDLMAGRLDRRVTDTEGTIVLAGSTRYACWVVARDGRLIDADGRVADFRVEHVWTVGGNTCECGEETWP